MAQNIAEFRIIGRIGAIESKDKVTFIDVAANYNRKDGDEWKTDTLWNRVTAFAKVAERVNQAGKGEFGPHHRQSAPEQLRQGWEDHLLGRSDRG